MKFQLNFYLLAWFALNFQNLNGNLINKISNKIDQKFDRIKSKLDALSEKSLVYYKNIEF